MHDKISELSKILNTAENIVFFSGAGMSTDSGIKDFRSADGLYSQKFKYPPETMLSHTFFMEHTADFYEFYKEKMLFSGIIPNTGHIILAELEKAGRLKAIVTQNIDGLHQLAGSINVIELHGAVARNFCMRCNAQYGADKISSCCGIPLCDKCGGIIKPDVVLYEEALNNETTSRAVDFISEADVLIVGGTSLVVYPAAGLINFFKGNKLVLINKSETSYDGRANLVIHNGISEVLSQAQA